MRRVLLALAALALLSACASAAPAPARPTPAPVPTLPPLPAKLLACMIADTGGIADRSFNAATWAGMQAAAAADRSVTVRYRLSATPADYAPNIRAFITEGCGLIVATGVRLGAAVSAAVAAHPRQRFIAVDCSYAGGCLTGRRSPAVYQLVFAADQAAFLAGYLAAGLSTTGKVGVFGGIALPTLTIYEDGFWDGVAYYDYVHAAHVQVLGWSEPAQAGMFSGDFTTASRAAAVTRRLIAAGADIIFPLAGAAGLGAAAVVKADAPRVSMMWPDSDGCVTIPAYCPYIVTSVIKDITAAVGTAVVSAANRRLHDGSYTGTLANDGVGLTPFRGWTGKIPVALQAELIEVQAGITSGKILVRTASPVK